jgi:hypothetical protein
LKKALVTSYLLLIVVSSACGSSVKNTESAVSVTPGVSPSLSSVPTATPKVSLPINESIMSKSKRQELTADGKEIVAFLDAYLHYYNLHAKSFVDGYDFNSIDALSSFGDGVISFKVLDKPVFKNTNQNAELGVHVEIKHNAQDDTPYLIQDCLFVFSHQSSVSEGWQLQYMFN